MAVRIFWGTDPDYEMVMEPKEPYSWSVGRMFIAKRKRDGKAVACNMIQLATAEGIELIRHETEAQKILDSCRGCRRWGDDFSFNPATLVVNRYTRALPVDEGAINLRTIIAEPTKFKTFDKASFFQIMASLVLGLQDCHANGIVHGDIKPENVGIKFSTFNDQPLASAFLAGFGIWTMATVSSPPGTKHNGSGIPGSPCYMAPECLDANNPSFSVKSDIFSLGCTLHELACKTKAFDGTDRSAVPAMTPAAANFLGNSLAPMPGKMMQLHPDQRPGLDALEKWSRDFCLHRIVKKLGKAAWASIALHVGAVTSIHNPIIAAVMVAKSREISAKAQALDTAGAQQALVDAFFEILTPALEPASAQPPPVQAGHSLTTPPQPPAAPSVQTQAGQLPQALRGLDHRNLAAPPAAVPPRVPTGYPPAVQVCTTPLAQPEHSFGHGAVPPVTPSQPAVTATTPAPAGQVPQAPPTAPAMVPATVYPGVSGHVPQAPPTAPAMVPAAVYPGAEGQTGNVYPVLTPNGYVYVKFPAGMLPQQPTPAAATSPPFQVPAEAWTPAQPATRALPPATVQPTSQLLTGYPPAMPPVQHIPAATTSPPQLPAVASLPPQEPERGVKGSKAISALPAADGQPTNQSVTGYIPAIPSPVARELAEDPSSTPTVLPGQASFEPPDPALAWLASQPQFLGEPASTPAAIDTEPAAPREAAPTPQPPMSTFAPAAAPAPAGDDLEFKSPLGAKSTFALGLMKALNSPVGGAALSFAANSHHPHTPAPHGGHHVPAAHPHHPTTHHQHGLARHGGAHHHGAHHGLQHPLHPQSSPPLPPPPYTQHAPPADLTQNIQMTQFAAGNTALQAQTDSFNAWRDSANAQFASNQQAQQQQLEAHSISDANRHADAQAWSLAAQGNTVLQVPFGGGDPRFLGGNTVSADGGLYMVGDPNRIIQG